MKKLLDDVAAFHRAGDVAILDRPSHPPLDVIALRVRLVDEEVNKELLPAMLEDRPLAEIADAMADSIYVIVGSALSYGIPLAEVWDIVQQANMAKVREDGKMLKDAGGKVIKPEGWQKPDAEIAALIEACWSQE